MIRLFYRWWPAFSNEPKDGLFTCLALGRRVFLFYRLCCIYSRQQLCFTFALVPVSHQTQIDNQSVYKCIRQEPRLLPINATCFTFVLLIITRLWNFSTEKFKPLNKTNEQLLTVVCLFAGKVVCGACGGKCSGEVLRVTDKYFHTGCFTCRTCSASLAKGGFFCKDGHYYCPQV